MEPAPQHEKFRSWQRALAEKSLSPEQLRVLEEMVEKGEVDSIETAAKMLDWQDTVINPEEHMYGL